MRNEPAFPRPASEYTSGGTLADGNEAIREQDGMTVREYFAIRVLQGIISNHGMGDIERHTATAVKYADGLIVALQNGGGRG